MTGINHIAGGIAFAGIFASFSDINIFDSPSDLAVTVVFSLMPDIDHPKSILGRVCFPVARYLDRHFGHRTLTHSLVCWLAVVVVFRLVLFVFLGSKGEKDANELTSNACLAYLSHLIFDMCTKSGIPFFYPFSSARCVIPGNPAMRLTTGELKTELTLFFIFNTLTLTCLPLMKQGFWMTYNNAFKTFSHLQNEFHRSQDGLEVTFQTKNDKPQTGAVIDTKENEAMVFVSGTFKKIEEGSTDILSFKHPQHKLIQEKVAFASISEDSLQRLLQHPIILLAISCNHELHYSEKGELKTGKSVRLEYADAFHFAAEIPDSSTLLHQIEEKKALITKEHERYQTGLDSLSRTDHRLLQLQKMYAFLTDYEKGKAIEQIKDLQVWKSKFHLKPPETEALEKEILFLKTRLPQKTRFSGYLISLKTSQQ